MYDNIHEGQYLIKLLASAVNNSPITPPPGELSWVKLYHLATFHKVANTAYYSLLKFPDSSIIPGSVWNKFSENAKKLSVQEDLQQFEVVQILSNFEQNQIFCVPLIGYVMKALYPSPDMRYDSNVDFLVREKDIHIIHTVMDSLGYTLIRSTDSNFSYYKAPNISIELSTSLMPKNNEFYDYFNGICNNLTPQEGFQSIYSITNEDLYIYTLTYLAQHYAAGGTGIRAILDVWVFLKHYGTDLNRELIATELNKLNLGLFSFYIEELAWIWFSGGDSFSDRSLYQEMESYLFSGSVGGDFKQPVKAALDSPEQPKYNNAVKDSPDTEVKRHLFPDLETMSVRYPILKKMPFLLPILWLARLAGALLTKHMNGKDE